MITKSQKELAFLHDLYVAPDWGERFAELVDAHVRLPKKGRALYVGAGTGSHALALQERAGEKLELLCVDESDECLELARAKGAAINEKTQFQREVPSSLSQADDQFELVLGNASMMRASDFRRTLSELVRVAAPGGTVAFWLPTASSFGEFFSIFWEALLNAELEEQPGKQERRHDQECTEVGEVLAEIRCAVRGGEPLPTHVVDGKSHLERIELAQKLLVVVQARLAKVNARRRNESQRGQRTVPRAP